MIHVIEQFKDRMSEFGWPSICKIVRHDKPFSLNRFGLKLSSIISNHSFMKGFALLRETDKSFDYHQLRLSSATGRREHGSRRHRPCRIERADPLDRFVICSNSAALYLKDKACFHVSGDVRRRSDPALRILAEAPATCGVSVITVNLLVGSAQTIYI
jgi:hypothetical protein